MREIRFRAWDEGNKVMHHNFQFITSGNEGDDWILFTSDEAPYEKDRKEGVVLNNPYFRQQLKIMQFTGLHDRNGKEIWEGDIVIIDGGLKWVCGWSDNHARFYFDTGLHKTDDFDSHEPYNFEVIGNVYENPDLLK